MEGLQVRYARTGDVDIAYAVVGDGPFDLVFATGLVSHFEHNLEWPGWARVVRRLSSFSRLILFDKRGTGLSERVAATSLDELMEDVRAVMDDVGTPRAALLGTAEGGPMSALFAATYPERTSALVLYSSYARGSWAPDYPWAKNDAEHEVALEAIDKRWGRTATGVRRYSPTLAPDPAFKAYFSRQQRFAATPRSARAWYRMAAGIDIRDILPSIHVPTLVLHRTGDQVNPVGGGRYLAEHIPGARFLEMPGDDYAPFAGDTEGLLNEIEGFLTGSRRATVPDRVLATVLVTDIVDSTRRASELGDRAWRELLDRHDAAVASILAERRGQQVRHTGDGIMATFEGPARAIRAADAIRSALEVIGVQVRCGLHCGECEVNGDDVGGLAVNVAVRIMEAAQPGRVLVSRTVKDLVIGSGIRFRDQGLHRLRGVPDEWRLFEVEAEPLG